MRRARYLQPLTALFIRRLEKPAHDVTPHRRRRPESFEQVGVTEWLAIPMFGPPGIRVDTGNGTGAVARRYRRRLVNQHLDDVPPSRHADRAGDTRSDQ